MEVLLQQIINGLVLGSMYALVALGYTMVYGIINLINFAHGEVLMVGALTSWTAIGLMKDAMPGAPGWVILVLATLIACVVAAALNFAIEKIAYRPLRNSPKLAPLITAIGMSILLQTLAMIIWKPNYKAYPTLLPSTPINIGGAVITPTQVMILAVTAISLATLMWLVNSTKLGRAMRATAENPRVAALMGVKPDMVISATFIIGAVLAAIAGVTAWSAAPNARKAETVIGLFALNGFLNITWSLIFFHLQRPDWAFWELLLLWCSILGLIVYCGRLSRLAGLLLLPYLAWVTIAGTLNWQVVQLNAPFG